jgi:DNA-binding CsgD family transcriptional regulator
MHSIVVELRRSELTAALRTEEARKAMRRREATLDFLAKCRSARSATEIAELLFEEMAKCGIRYVACASHVDPLNPPPGAVAIVNYPIAWLKWFSERNYAQRDPIFWGAGFSPVPFWWDEFVKCYKLERDQKRILNEARECGLSAGVTIPIYSPNAFPASCSLVPGPDGFDPLDLPDLQFMALHAHAEAMLRAGAAVQPPVLLTKRQQECLTLAGVAKSDWAIGKILGISSRTVHHHLENAKRRYGVSHRVQAVVQAMIDGQITPHDLKAVGVEVKRR